MQRDSETLIGEILSPEPIPGGQVGEGEGEAKQVYVGPERRAQGYLIAEIIPDFPPVDGQEPEIDRRR